MEPWVSEDLGRRLERARLQRFVGRRAELELLAARLAAAEDTPSGRPDPASAFGVLWVSGPGGVGKSSLLAAYARTARQAGWSVRAVDASQIPATPAAIATAARSAARESLVTSADGELDAPSPFGSSGQRQLLLIDGAERLAPIEEWLRQQFLPALPSSCLVVIGSRRIPAAAWLADPGWRELLRTISLRNLAPPDVAALLAAEALPARLLPQLMALTHGHPLAVSLLLDALRRSGSEKLPTSLAERPDLVRALLAQLVDDTPTGQHRAALYVCAHAATTTEPALRAALPDADEDEVAALWDWLCGLSIVEDSRTGIRPHEVARDLLQADLQRRDPDMFAAIHRRLRSYMVEQVKAQAGNPIGRQQVTADLLFLVRHHPIAGRYWDWEALVNGVGEPATAAHWDGLVALTRETQGDQQAALVAHWLDRQPGAFRVFRRADGDIGGFAACLHLHVAQREDIEADPGAAALWRYSQQHRPPRPGEQVLAWRFVVDRDPDERRPRLAGSMFGLWHVTDILLRPATAWEFDACYTNLDYWEVFLNHWDFVHVPEADYWVDGTRYVSFAHDWRRVGVADWLERTTARELGEQVGLEPVQPAAALSEEEFTASVKQALQDLHRPVGLATNTLLASNLVQGRARKRPEDRPEQILRELLAEAAAAVRADPRAAAYYRVLDRTYLRPAPTQEKAAEVLDLPFSTYRRYRDRGLRAVTQWLWDRDLDSADDTD